MSAKIRGEDTLLWG